jgi:serine/threonine protein kinase
LKVNDEKLNTSFLGTPAYFAPEIVTRSGHTRMLDWYNLGVLLYELLVGIPPFYARERVKKINRIKEGGSEILIFKLFKIKFLFFSLLKF